MTIKQQGGIFGRNPTFNDLTVEGTVLVPADSMSGDAINGGTATPSKIIMEGSGAMLELYRSGANANFGAIEFNDTTNTGVNAKIGWNANLLRLEGTSTIDLVTNNTSAVSISSTNVVSFKSTGGTTEMYFNGANLVMAAGRGIDFSATSGTGTSELFDDYEEGTWTATVGCTGNATTTTTVTAYYTKIGRQVTVSFRDLNDIDTTGLSGFLTVTLPFTCISASVGFIGALIWDSLTYPAGYDLVFPYVANGGSAMAFAIGGSGIADSLLDVSAVTSGTTDLKYATLTYFTA